MNSALVSIIVPVYNAGSYIRQTIDMVIAQTYKDWELILVNDCSTDAGAEVITSYLSELKSNKIVFIDKKINEGAAKARNTGLDAAKGRYIAFLDADDIWKADKLEKEMLFMKEKGSGFVFAAYEFGDQDAVPTGKTCRVPATLNYRQALSRTIIFTSTVLIDTEKVDKKLIYMPEVESEDTATWWKILKSGIDANGLDIPLVIYRRPSASLSSDKGKAIKRIWKLYRREGLSVLYSALLFIQWAFRATYRRLVPDRNR